MTIKTVSRFFGKSVLCIILMSSTSAVRATLPIELEVAIDSGSSLTAPQEWTGILGKMGLARVRLRGIRASDQPVITPLQVGKSTHFQVLAILSSRDELILPEHRFRTQDRRKLQTYFEQLPAEAQHRALPRGRFDLTEDQIRDLLTELSQPVSFSTKDETGSNVLRRLEETLSVPIVRSPQSTILLTEPWANELRGVSTGTALAIGLRQQGLVLRPEQPRGETLRLTVEIYDRERDAWPVGWKPERSVRLVAPQMFKQITLEARDITFSEVLSQLQPQLKVPVLQDHWILTQRKIAPEQVPIKMARRKTYLKGALDRLASQARLATELRVDEQGEPFIWITQFGKDSPQATK